MNKSEGTTLSAALLAVLLFHSGGSSLKTPGDSSTSLRQQKKSAAGKGPWAASCKYWAPARAVTDGLNQEPSEEISLTRNHRTLSGRITTHADNVGLCGETADKKWGFPAADNRSNPEISSNLNVITVIATVADPAHTNLGFQFDRSIDALIEAAGANGYSNTYYWLPAPWIEQVGKSKENADTSAEQSSSDQDQDHEPGLIIFRRLASRESSGSPLSVLYLFLVGETPTSGVDGLQIQKALRYQNDLKDQIATNAATSHWTFARSFRRNGSVAVIGPTISASAVPLRQAIDLEFKAHQDISSFDVVGSTATSYAADALTKNTACPPKASGAGPSEPCVHYSSFEAESSFADGSLVRHVKDDGDETSRVIILIEDGTAFAQASVVAEDKSPSGAIIIRFPREISLLRNAETEQTTGSSKKEDNQAPTPYLQLSLRDSNISDSVPHLSGRITPYSQESELMAIQREVERERANYIVISSTNILDSLFLAQFLHRAVPDARLVFERADLLFEREIDDEAYIGSLAVTPYPLTWLRTLPFPDSYAQEYYNASSYTFWDKDQKQTPSLQLDGLKDFTDGTGPTDGPRLWLTAVGSDGYYPIGTLDTKITDVKSTNDPAGPDLSTLPAAAARKMQPALTWYFLCLLISILCVAHPVLMCVADFWSPFTRDLDLRDNDQKHRRTMCILIGTFMLFSMAMVVAWPLFASRQLIQWNGRNLSAAIVTLAGGLVNLLVTLLRTRKYWYTPAYKSKDAWFYNVFNLAAAVALLFVAVIWTSLCSGEWLAAHGANAHSFFAYRCLNPSSGVSPLVPLLLLLFSWYLWSYFQTLRLRFSRLNRPRLPGQLKTTIVTPLYVSDNSLKACGSPRSNCLFRNIDCLLITREIVLRYVKTQHRHAVDLCLRVGYLVMFIVLAVGLSVVHSVDRVLWKPYSAVRRTMTSPSSPFLSSSSSSRFFFAGWLRWLLSRASLKRGLLQQLENMPLRFAFDRIKATGWVIMFRQSGLREQWRDMARSTESMRQIVNDKGLMDRYDKNRAGQAPQTNLTAGQTREICVRSTTSSILMWLV